MTSKIEYKLITSTDDHEPVLQALIEAYKDSPFSKITASSGNLKELISKFCVDTSNKKRFIMVAKDGDKIVGITAAMSLDDHFLFADAKAGQEMVWWVHPDYRRTNISKELMECLDTWAKHIELKYLFMSHYENDYTPKMKKMYTKFGYTPVEYTYWKEIA